MPSSDQPTTPMNAQSAAPSVSVIMPVYNSQDYVEEAIRSLLDQDFDSFEVIAIDDGSTDASGAICDRLAAEDSRLRVIHKSNGGLCAARNTGIAEARGEYIMFCDNDDVAYPGFIADNYRLAKKHDADMVRFGRVLVRYANGVVWEIDEITPKKESILEGLAILGNLDLLLSLSCGVWSALYRKELIESNSIRFDEELRAGVEDHLFNDEIYKYAQRIVLNPHAYYEWRRRSDHSTSAYFSAEMKLGFEKMLAVENHLVSQAGLSFSHSPRYADHMMLPLMDALRSDAGGNVVSYKRALRSYEMLHSLYEPYYDEMKIMPLSRKHRVALRLLEDERYRSLYAYGYIGMRIKNKFKASIQKSRSSRLARREVS